MAKDGDLMDFLCETIFSAIGWVLGLLIKMTWGLISGIFGGIWRLIMSAFDKD